MSFKLGDRVRINDPASLYYHLSGRTSDYDGDSVLSWLVRFDDGRHFWFGNSELEPEAKTVYVTKGSGERQEFGNGSVRDTETGKPRYDLITPVALKRLAELMSRGAEKYGERNWEKGQPTSRFMSSMLRHTQAYRLGERDEDHLAAIAYNAFALMHFEGTEWDDINREGE